MINGGPVRLLILVRGFSAGGAERQLLTYLGGLDPEKIDVTVACFYREIWHDQAVAGTKARIVALGKKGRYDFLGFLWQLIKVVRQTKPEILYGYGGTACLPALLVAKILGLKVIWGIRNAEVIPSFSDNFAVLTAKLALWVSGLPDGHIANSKAGANTFIAAGYPSSRMTVIPNGIDVERFHRDEAGREKVRGRWKISADEILIGLVARPDPRKEHETFLRAAAILVSRGRQFKFVCVGEANNAYTDNLIALTAELGIKDRVIWGGYQQDVAAVYSALDINVLCSGTEGFPNTLCEAMACQIACAATDVGDCREILGELGRILPFRNPNALADEIDRLASQDLVSLGARARDRIQTTYSVAQMTTRTTDYFDGVAAASREKG